MTDVKLTDAERALLEGVYNCCAFSSHFLPAHEVCKKKIKAMAGDDELPDQLCFLWAAKPPMAKPIVAMMDLAKGAFAGLEYNVDYRLVDLLGINEELTDD